MRSVCSAESGAQEAPREDELTELRTTWYSLPMSKKSNILFEEDLDSPPDTPQSSSNRPKPINEDFVGCMLENGSSPLPNAKHEQFAYYLFCGENNKGAYMNAYPDANDKTAEVESTRLRKRPEIQARISWLNKYMAGTDLSEERKYAIKECARVMRTTSDPKLKFEAMDRLAKMGNWHRENDNTKLMKARPDPAFMFQFVQKLNTFAGHNSQPQEC